MSPAPSPTPSPTSAPSPSPAPGPAPSPAPSPKPTPTPPPSTPLSPPQQQLASSLTQATAQQDQLQAEIQQNQDQQTQLEAQVSGDQAQTDQLGQQIQRLREVESRLKVREATQRTQLDRLARAMYAQPPSVLLGIVESSSLGAYLTEDAGVEDAAQRAHQVAGQLEQTRHQDHQTQQSLTDKRNQVQAEQQQVRASLAQLQQLAAQLQSQQAQLGTDTATTQGDIAQAQAQGGSLSASAGTQLTELGTGGLDQQALNAGVASGLYTLSSSSLPWPKTPDASPLGLSADPDYCIYTPVQCTCYAANAYQAYTGGALPQTLGNGGQWIAAARAAGIPTSSTPSEGAVVSFSGAGYSADGHVAVVRSVIYASGRAVGLVVWERNFDLRGGFDVRLVALGAGSQIAGYIPAGA